MTHFETLLSKHLCKWMRRETFSHTVNELFCIVNIEDDFFTFPASTTEKQFFAAFQRNFSPFENP